MICSLSNCSWVLLNSSICFPERDSINAEFSSSDFEISIKDLALKIANHLKFKGKIIWDNSKPDGTPKKQLNIEKIQELGWKPKIDLDKGIAMAIKSYEEEIYNYQVKQL